jgi:hypothetical protein
MQGVTLTTVSSVDVQGVSLSSVSSVDVQGVSLSTVSSVDVQGLSLATVSSVATGFFECLFSSTEENKKPICKTKYILHVIIAFHWFYSIARIT